jgi:hypothetical protein
MTQSSRPVPLVSFECNDISAVDCGELGSHIRIYARGPGLISTDLIKAPPPPQLVQLKLFN